MRRKNMTLRCLSGRGGGEKRHMFGSEILHGR
jgi:hypothetical protein